MQHVEMTLLHSGCQHSQLAESSQNLGQVDVQISALGHNALELERRFGVH